ncbi:MAG: Fic family protein [Leptolyngbya sp. PLA3]|nr:MAG: Fic family protein [Cyanobacteria bacterium CYA]MCE7967357.1 Fic family protein [Leptolyngbya sp. PL-A3]
MAASKLDKAAPGRLVPVTLTERAGPNLVAKPVDTLAYVPNPLPPDLDWKYLVAEHYDRLEQTLLALGRINGLHKRVGNAAGLLRTLWMREAKLSSQIEDIQTTAEDLVLAGAGRQLGVRQQGREAWNYVRALEHGVTSDLPMSVRLLCEMHKLLMSDVRGADCRPGELRKIPVYIGDPEKGPRHARFIPTPPGDALRQSLDDLERFIHAEQPRIAPLLRIALVHYQFETIHPFGDGNGRIGRVMVSRSLVKVGLLDHPVVYMSAYINRHKQRYVDLLLKISLEGGQAWSDWIAFMVEAIRTQALDAIERSERLISLRSDYQELLTSRNAPARLFVILDRLFSLPAINAAESAELVQVTDPTSYKDLSLLEELGILTEYTGRRRDRDWVARDIINVIESDDHSENAANDAGDEDAKHERQ